MSLTITRARVKEKCGIADTAYDTTIDNLIAELTPVLEFAIEPIYLSDADVLPILNLGATEIVCGEFLAQQSREPGATEGFTFNGLEVYSRKNLEDADKLKAQGAARIASYLRMPCSVVAVNGKEGA